MIREFITRDVIGNAHVWAAMLRPTVARVDGGDSIRACGWGPYTCQF
jgi:hypothetical protein